MPALWDSGEGGPAIHAGLWAPFVLSYELGGVCTASWLWGFTQSPSGCAELHALQLSWD